MSWRIARSLLTLRDQINDLAPNRSKTSDGAVGDAAHASRASDHNPWVTDGTMGVVTALDITHDPANGADAGKLAEALRISGDPRIKYIISNRRIASPGQPWRAYTGANPHTRHFHVSVKATQEDYDSEQPWDIGELMPDPEAVPVRVRPKIHSSSVGEDVRFLQRQLKVKPDGYFGPKTEEALKAFQEAHGLPADGVCGPYTWDAIEGKAGESGAPVRTPKSAVMATLLNSRTIFRGLAAAIGFAVYVWNEAISITLAAVEQFEALQPVTKLLAAFGVSLAAAGLVLGFTALGGVMLARIDDAAKGRNVK